MPPVPTSHRRRAACIVALIASCGAAAAAQSALPRVAPESVGLRQAPLDEATTLLQTFVAEQKIAGAVAAVARRGRIGYLEAVGVQDMETRAPMTDRTLFRIYSMTKPVTAVAVMMLHDEGRFALNDPVSRYLPELDDVMVVDATGGSPRRPVRPITVEDLLLHTSGLSHRTSDLYRRLQVRSRADTLPQLVAKIAKAPLMEDPGTRFRYSEATTILGRLVEIWSGKALDRFFAERIFAPLGMTDTSFWVRPEQAGRLATVYGPQPEGGLRPVDLEAVPFTARPALLEGAVGLVSTVPDFLRLSQMLLNKGELGGRRLLQARTVERMTVNALPNAVLKGRGGQMGWGLANVNVLMAASPGSANRGEFGWDGTAGTIFWIDPATETVVILMTQSSPPNPDGLRQKFKALVQRAIAD